MRNELTAFLIHLSSGWKIGSRMFSTVSQPETPFPCIGEIGNRHWHILRGFQHQCLKESSLGVKLISTILARLCCPGTDDQKSFFLVHNEDCKTLLRGETAACGDPAQNELPLVVKW